MVLEGINISVTGAAEVYFQSGNTGTRSAAAADVTPANANFGSGRTATGIFEQGADLEDGATLTTSVEVERYRFIGDTATGHINFPQDFIMPKGSTFTIWVDSTATVTATLYLNYHPTSLG